MQPLLRGKRQPGAAGLDVVSKPITSQRNNGTGGVRLGHTSYNAFCFCPAPLPECKCSLNTVLINTVLYVPGR